MTATRVPPAPPRLPLLPARPPAGPRRRRARTAVLALVAACWLAAGGVGTYHYVHRYWLYRGFAAPVTPAGIPAGTIDRVSFFSPALHQRRAMLVYLPPGYARQAAAGRRFPALFLLHPPPGRPDGFFLAGRLAVESDMLLARHAIRPMLLAVPFGKSPRFRNDTEWANAGAGPYESYALDAVRYVDTHFATLRTRRARGIAGISEGGYGAVNVGLHHLGLFSVIESWSGYFDQTPTGPFLTATPAQLRANTPNLEVPALAPRIRRLGLRAFLFQGDRDGMPPANLTGFAAELRRAGATVRWGFFPGGHDWALWRAQTPRMLEAASGWFHERPTARGGGGAVTGHAQPALSPALRAALRRRDRALRRALRQAAVQRAHRQLRRTGP